MNSIICQLIESKNRVIIPAFGAFVSSRDGDSIAISFNQYLNFDDGLLTSFVAQQRGIDTDAAKAAISQYVSELNSRLDAGETVVIDGIGSLCKDGSRIDFAYDTLAVRSTALDNVNSNMNQDNEPANSNIEFVDDTPRTEPSQPYFAPQQPADNSYDTDNSAVYVQPAENRRPTWLWILIIVVLFLVAVWLCLFVFNKDNAVYEFFFPQEEVVVEEPKPAAPDTTKVVEPEPAPAPVAEPKTTTLGKSFYIVVGTYNDQSIARHRVEQLKAKGFEGAFEAQYDGKYVAVIAEHTSLVEAEAQQEQIVDNYRIESYIVNGGQ